MQFELISGPAADEYFASPFLFGIPKETGQDNSVGGVSIVDLGSAVGLLFSILPESEHIFPPISQIMPTLDLFSRFLNALAWGKFKTLCVCFDGMAQPFWFGSTLNTVEIHVLDTRQGLLEKALFSKGLFLPLVPPQHQELISKHIMDMATGKIPASQDTPWWKVARQLCVKLFQLMTVPGDSSRTPWKLAETPTEEKQTNFTRIRGEIAAQISLWTEKPATLTEESIVASLEFSVIKKSLVGTKKLVGLPPVYGHCAETYPFIFLLKRQVFVLFSRPLRFPCARAGYRTTLTM